MTRDVERLYNCPDCDEFILEEQYSQHRKECDGIERTWRMSELELSKYIENKRRSTPHWEDRFEAIRKSHEEIMSVWVDKLRSVYDPRGVARRRQVLPLGNGIYEFHAMIPQEFDPLGANMRGSDIATNTHIYRVVCHIPEWLKRDEASALCWEQLEAQWPISEHNPYTSTRPVRSFVV